MPQLRRENASRLLRTVGNKPHASSEDHEEDARQTASAIHDSKPQMREEDIYADPKSSDDEAAAAPPTQTPTMSQTSSTSTSTRDQPRGRVKSKTGAPKKGQKKRSVRAPPRGTYEKGRAHKGRYPAEDKEDVEGPSSSGEKRGIEEDTVYFGMGDTPRKKQRTANVHVAAYAPASRKKLFGKPKPNTPLPIPKKKNLAHIRHLDKALSGIIDEVDPYCDISDDELSSSPAKPPQSIRSLPADYAATSSLPTNSESHETSPSSPLTSLPDDEIPFVLEEFPLSPSKPDEDTICALCQDQVDESEQIRFWTHHPNRTVRNQMLFCKEHKRSKAQREYRAQGFPEIDWISLPCRIRNFRAELVKLLRNETEEESEYRRRHAERLVSGKAAALPSKKRGRKVQNLEKETLDRFDAGSSSTGYYGPRGKRVIMEVITADLSDTIREVAAKDPVVGRSGFAMFLQAVLVPELTIMLVMEDNEVGRGMAQQLIRESAELGTLLHEEVEDEVRLGSDEEEEDEDQEDDC